MNKTKLTKKTKTIKRVQTFWETGHFQADVGKNAKHILAQLKVTIFYLRTIKQIIQMYVKWTGFILQSFKPCFVYGEQK